MMVDLAHVIAPTHPLKAWRLTQAKDRKGNTLSIAKAAALGGWPAPTWAAWEKFPDEGGLIPTHANMVLLFIVTGGQIRPDHFYRLPSREALAELRFMLADMK